MVALGGIAYAEHKLFPKYGLSEYWMGYKGLKNNMPAVITWGVCLVFGFGLNFLNIIPFYYLFVPTWFLAVGLYMFLAKQAGAGEDFTEQKAAEAAYNRRVVEFQAEQARLGGFSEVKDTTTLIKIIKAIWIVVGLVVPAVLAWRVMFDSPDLYTYFVNRELFYDLTIWCTVIYFVFAYWDLQRHKSINKVASAKARASLEKEEELAESK